MNSKSQNQVNINNAEIENLRMKNEHLQQLLNSKTEIYEKTLEVVIRERNEAISEARFHLQLKRKCLAVNKRLMQERDNIVCDLISNIPSSYRKGFVDTYKTKPNTSLIQIQRLETAMEASMILDSERKTLTQDALR